MGGRGGERGMRMSALRAIKGERLVSGSSIRPSVRATLRRMFIIPRAGKPSINVPRTARLSSVTVRNGKFQFAYYDIGGKNYMAFPRK